MRADDVVQERLIRPHDRIAALVVNDRREEAEVRAARLLQPALQDLADDGRRLPGPQADDRLHAAAILVPHRKAEQEVFDRREAGLRELGGLTRTDALQERQWRLQDVSGMCGTRVPRRATGAARRACAPATGRRWRAGLDVDSLDARRQIERLIEIDAVRQLGRFGSS